MLYKHLPYIFILSIHVSYAQTSVSDTTFMQRMLDSTISFYNKSLGENTLLYNGREYTGNYSRTVGHPFFGSEHPQKGSVLYDETLYPHSAITYDLTTDEVFIKTPENRSLKLLSEKIDHFSLGDDVFVRVVQQPDRKDGPVTGFYEVLYGGGITVLAKRKKQLEPSFNLEDPYRFVQYDRYFIKTKDAYREIDSEGSLMSLFPGKDETRKYMRKNGINFKKNRENAIIQVAAYYDQIKKL
jgi:hypothetical protein